MRAFLIVLLLASPAAAADCAARVIDGDTLSLPATCVTLPPTVAIRIRGIDTPELRGKCDAEIALAKRAREFTRHALEQAGKVVYSNVQPDKYGGRYDATVLLDGRNLGDMLVSAGLARRYDGRGKRAGWCE